MPTGVADMIRNISSTGCWLTMVVGLLCAVSSSWAGPLPAEPAPIPDPGVTELPPDPPTDVGGTEEPCKLVEVDGEQVWVCVDPPPGTDPGCEENPIPPAVPGCGCGEGKMGEDCEVWTMSPADGLSANPEPSTLVLGGLGALGLLGILRRRR